MERLGKCAKCGKLKPVRDHHHRGYYGVYKDDVIPYCRACDRKAHDKARKEGKCKLTPKNVLVLSACSAHRRSYKKKNIRTSLSPNIGVHEVIQVNKNTNNISIQSYFSTHYGTPKLKVIKEADGL